MSDKLTHGQLTVGVFMAVVTGCLFLIVAGALLYPVIQFFIGTP